jgi:RNA polymerase sigma-70 factor (ECF subfamily)
VATVEEESVNTSAARSAWLEKSVELGLVRAAQQGNRLAFLAMVEHYQRPLYRLAYALTRRRDDAATITRESFERAWAGIHGMPEGKRFFPWVLRMARNLSVAHARRRAGEPTAAPDLNALASSDEREEAEGEFRILDAFRSLRPDEQMALALRVVERLPYKEIAEMLDQSVGLTIARLSTSRGFLLARAAGDIPYDEATA